MAGSRGDERGMMQTRRGCAPARVRARMPGRSRCAGDGMLDRDSVMGTVFTIGHSSHSVEVFADLLVKHGIQVVVDVRSAPYSRYAPQFDRDILPRPLNLIGVKYLFLGRELGG